MCVNVESAGGDGQHRGGGQPGAGPSRGVPDARRRGAAAAQPDPSGPRRDDRLAFVAVLPRGRQCWNRHRPRCLRIPAGAFPPAHLSTCFIKKNTWTSLFFFLGFYRLWNSARPMSACAIGTLRIRTRTSDPTSPFTSSSRTAWPWRSSPTACGSSSVAPTTPFRLVELDFMVCCIHSSLGSVDRKVSHKEYFVCNQSIVDDQWCVFLRWSSSTRQATWSSPATTWRCVFKFRQLSQLGNPRKTRRTTTAPPWTLAFSRWDRFPSISRPMSRTEQPKTPRLKVCFRFTSSWKFE